MAKKKKVCLRDYADFESPDMIRMPEMFRHVNNQACINVADVKGYCQGKAALDVKAQADVHAAARALYW
jgi:hypothetical protein